MLNINYTYTLYIKYYSKLCITTNWVRTKESKCLIYCVPRTSKFCLASVESYNFSDFFAVYWMRVISCLLHTCVYRWYYPGVCESGLFSNLLAGLLNNLWGTYAQWPVRWEDCSVTCDSGLLSLLSDLRAGLLLVRRFAQWGRAGLISDMWWELLNDLWEVCSVTCEWGSLSDLWAVLLSDLKVGLISDLCVRFAQWHVRWLAYWNVSQVCSVTSLLSY